MLGSLDFWPDFTDNPVFVNKKGLAVDAHILLASILLFLLHAIELRHRGIGIGQQRIRQPIFIGKFLMGRYAVGTDTEDDDTAFLRLTVGIAERARFSSAARSVVFGRKDSCENNVLPFKRGRTVRK